MTVYTPLDLYQICDCCFCLRSYFPNWLPSSSQQQTTSLEQQAIAMRDCKAFIALVSDAYVADPLCCDMFQYARQTLRKPFIMVVLGQGAAWRKSKIGILVADEVRAVCVCV